MKIKTQVTMLVAGICLFAQVAFGQILGGNKPNAEFVPESAFAAGMLFPKSVMGDEKFELIPHEIITAWGQQEFGFDPMMIDRATFVVKTPQSLDGNDFQWAAALRFEEIEGLSDKLSDAMNGKKIGGKTLYSKGRGPSFLVHDDSTILVGEEDYLEDLLNADGSGDLAKLVKASGLRGQAYGFVDINSVRNLINEQLAQVDPGMLPPAIAQLLEIPDLVTGIEASVGMRSSLETKLIMQTDSEEDAEELKEILVSGIAMGKQMLMAQLAMQMNPQDPIQEASLRYAQRLGNSYEKKLTPRVSGKQVTLTLENEASMVPILVGMLLPAVQQVRGAARRTDSANRVRQMMLAMHNYADAQGRGAFPAQANYDAAGKPLLSWRVHVLPYLEEQALYDRFRLDEPWDSPHNRELIKEMPEFYVCPDVAPREGHTVYLGIAGKGMAMGKEPMKFQNFTDGMSNTAVMVEVNPGDAVIWTKPEDYNADPRNPMKGLGRIRPQGFNAGFADGSIRFISSDTDDEIWKAMMTVSGGEVINN